MLEIHDTDPRIVEQAKKANWVVSYIKNEDGWEELKHEAEVEKFKNMLIKLLFPNRK